MKGILLSVALVVGVTACASVPQRIEQMAWGTYVYVPTEGNRYADSLADLTARLTAHGLTIEVVDTQGHGFGLNFGNGRIVLSQDLSVDGQFEVLAHEAGHLFHPHSMETSVKEMFAELVGLQVQQFYGSTVAESASMAYLAQHKHAMIFYPILKPEIDRATKILTGQLPWPRESC